MKTKTGDWKGEKHVPVIEFEERESGHYHVVVSIGKEIPHPNTAEHHIAWVELYFTPEGAEFPVMVGRADFASHGDVATHPRAEFCLRTDKKGKLSAVSYCNIHGLWESEKEL